MLWFAFKIYIFGFLIQLLPYANEKQLSCDLLSKFISLAFWYNLTRAPDWNCKVVICFQNLYLWLSDTTQVTAERQVTELWFAFKIYIFGFLIQQLETKEYYTTVVICFQNLYLWLSDTTDSLRNLLEFGLWFAFKIYIFGFLIQLRKRKCLWRLSCDLLSKFISLAFWYNPVPFHDICDDVVICFQNLYLWLSDTTKNFIAMGLALLWFAFKIYIFGFLIQPHIRADHHPGGCDLLSKFISLAFWYNGTTTRSAGSYVVICFQNLYLWLSDTTQKTGEQVWLCCDLLSKFISLAFWNNREESRWIHTVLWFAFKIYIFGFLIQQCFSLTGWIEVVICFQNLYLWLSDTTPRYKFRIPTLLWFAFKIYIFGFLIQLALLHPPTTASCDLLSKFISLAFWYNTIAYVPNYVIVVICFQNLYLWLSDTTVLFTSLATGCCDLLSKFISLAFWYNSKK